MSATSFVRKWDSPEKTRVSGLPPGPDATISHTARGEVRRHDVHAINPYYKTDPSSHIANGGVGLHISRESKIEPKQFSGTPDYKLEKEQESYKLNIIDPKVNPHSNYPSRSNTLPTYFRKQPKSTDFPSAHSKRSFLKMTPLEPRRLRSLETKNITPHDYLSESLERHRALSMSPLRENLKVNERDINQPWNAARRPGPKVREKESTFTKTTEETFTRGKYRPPPNLNDSSSWQYTTSNNFSPRSLISINGHHTHDDHGLLRVQHSPSSRHVQSSYTMEQTRPVPQQQMWPFPAVLVPVAPAGAFTYEVKEDRRSNVDIEHRRPRYYEDDGSRQSTMIKVKDVSMKQPKPKSIIKQMQNENWESHRTASSAPAFVRHVPKMSETAATTEETKRTEEVERRVTASEKKKAKQKRLGNRSYVTHTVHSHERKPHGEGHLDSGDWREHAITQTGHRSGDSFYRDTGNYASRQGKLSDRREHEEDFYTNGRSHGFSDVRKTHSNKDVYGTDDTYINGPRPIVEYPPTLPRSEDHYAERNVRRSNSMNDWSLQPRYYQDPGLMNRYGEMTGLEREFRDTLSMPLPFGQNINEREFREERIPGGHESFSREVKANTGTRQNNPNDVTHFSESKQEVSFKREQALDR